MTTMAISLAAQPKEHLSRLQQFAVVDKNAGIHLIKEFNAMLATYQKGTRPTKATFNARKKDLRKFLYYLLTVIPREQNGIVAVDSLEKIDAMVVGGFINWLLNPPPIDIASPRRFDHPDWKPLSGKLIHSSINQLIIGLSSLWSYALKTQSFPITQNPFLLVAKVKSSEARESLVEKRLKNRDFSREGIKELCRFLTMKRRDFQQDPFNNRDVPMFQWLFTLLIGTGSRVSAAANARYDKDIFYIKGHPHLRLKVKGGEEHVLAWTEHLEEAYRLFVNDMKVLLGEKYGEDVESYPYLVKTEKRIKMAINKKSGQPKEMTPNTIWLLTKDLFVAAKEAADNGELEFSDDDYARLEYFSPHWFRHYLLTQLVNDKDFGIEVARQIAGHKDPRTTAKYAHKDQEQIERGLSKYTPSVG